MSIKNTIRALPALTKVAFAEAVAYRAELLIWVLSTTMPLIMLALWSAVARDAPVGRFGQAEFTAYFLAALIVRQLTSAWAAWEMNFEVRTGALSMRLLRPVHPLWTYAVENLAAMPLRLVISMPVGVVALILVGGSRLTRDPLLWAIWPIAMLGAWLITFLFQVAIGALSLFLESSLKVMDVYLAAFFVFSGYLVPVELFGPGLRAAAAWMPFRYQLGYPVELMTAALDRSSALVLLGRQWAFVLVLLVVVSVVWRRGLRRFAAYGG